MDPSEVIQRIPLLRDAEDLSISPLHGGLTNVNYLVTAHKQQFALRIAGPNGDVLGIDRSRELKCLQRAEEAGIGPEVVAFFPEGHLVTRFLDSATPFSSEEFTNRENVPRVARRLRDVHALAPVEGAFKPRDDILRWTGLGFRADLAPDTRFNRLRARIDEKRPAGLRRSDVLCHNDPYYRNFFDDHGELRLIDWEYAGVGDPLFDLAGVAYVLDDQDSRRSLLAAYGADERLFSMENLVEMIGVFLCWNAAWTLVQMELTTIDFDYEAFFRYLLDLAEAEGLV